MIPGPGFSYAQARLQARHGARPDTRSWQRLQGIGDLAGYLEAARHTPLRPWVLGLPATFTTHQFELALRTAFRGYVDEVARWLPRRWRTSITLIAHLPQLPALQHLLDGAEAPAWMRDDPLLRPFAQPVRQARVDALRRSDYAYVVTREREPGRPLAVDWLAHWRSAWPRDGGMRAGLEALSSLLYEQLQRQQVAGAGPTSQQRRWLAERLGAAFRRYSFEPAAACAHLALVAFDLERLRGALVRRCLGFPRGAVAA